MGNFNLLAGSGDNFALLSGLSTTIKTPGFVSGLYRRYRPPTAAKVRSQPSGGRRGCCLPRVQPHSTGGEANIFKFYYHGPKDNRERFIIRRYRSGKFHCNYVMRNQSGGTGSEYGSGGGHGRYPRRSPARGTQFKWSLRSRGEGPSATPAIRFKLLIRAGCDYDGRKGCRGICGGTWFAKAAAPTGTTTLSITTNLLK